MKRRIVILLCALALSVGCARVAVEKPDGTSIKVWLFGIDPKVGRLKTDNLELTDAEYSSDPGVRLAELLFEAGKAAGAAAAEANR